MAYAKKKMNKRTKGKGKRSKTVSVPKLYRMVQKMKPEVKEKVYQFNSIGPASVSLASVGFGSSAIAPVLCNGITQGTGDSNRIGNNIRLIGIKFQFAVQPGDNTNYFRLLILRPKNEIYNFPTGGSTLVQNILSGTASSATQWLAPVDTDRYQVFYDKRAYLDYGAVDGSTSTTVPKRIKFFERFIKLNTSVQWDFEGNIMRDFLLLAISDSTIAPNPGVVAGYLKLYYTDA